MRTAFIETLCELAEKDERIWLLTGDLGYSVLERFCELFPERYVNMGVAEQNMTGVAAGLALSGKTVFTYSIANFPVMRCLEQIRNDVCYHNLNVKIVSVGGGLSYGTAGYSHHGIEDLSVMKSMPHMTVIAPADPVEAKCAARAIAIHPGPCYLRLGKGGESVIYPETPDFRIGKAVCLRDGQDIAIISTGDILSEIIKAADDLRTKDIYPFIIHMPTLKPMDETIIKYISDKVRKIYVVEEHSAIGGLSASIAMILSIIDSNCKLLPICLLPEHIHIIGTQTYLRCQHGTSAGAISKLIYETL